MGASLYRLTIKIVLDVTEQLPLTTLYRILSALPSLFDVFLGKQHIPELLLHIQLLFQVPLLLPQSHTTVPACPDTVTAVPKLPLASQKLMGPALETVPRVGEGPKSTSVSA